MDIRMFQRAIHPWKSSAQASPVHYTPIFLWRALFRRTRTLPLDSGCDLPHFCGLHPPVGLKHFHYTL